MELETARTLKPEIGQRMIWIKGGTASKQNQDPVAMVWIAEETDYNYVVVDEKGVRHSVLDNRLLYVADFKAWIDKKMNKVSRPPIIAAYIEHAEQAGRVD